MTAREILQEIRSDLPRILGQLKEHSPQTRSLADAEVVSETLSEILQELQEFSLKHSHLVRAFDKDFGSIQELSERENMIDLLFLEDYLFPSNKMLPLYDEHGTFAASLCRSYPQTIKDWIQAKLTLHNESQQMVLDFQDPTVNPKLSCACQKCQGDLRAKIRKLLFDRCLELITKAELYLQSNLDTISALDASQVIYDLQRNIENQLKHARFGLKRSEWHKLDQNLKRPMGERFVYPAPLALKYSEKIHQSLENYLKEQNYTLDLIQPSEYERFYQQLGLNLWRNERFILREFTKLVSTFLRYKREDISSNILQDYLGQFWLHSEARKINRRIIYHMGPTNSGKTYQAIEALAKAKKGCYLAPLRLLAGELFDTLNAKGVYCTLLTGEEVIEVPDATHTSSTIEMAQLKESFDCCVIDEIQMLADPQRGWAWTRALINMNAPEIHLCGDDSVRTLLEHIVQLTGDTLEIKTYHRLTELQIMSHPVHLADLKKHDALIVFSRRNALKYKRDLEQLDFKVSIVYGRLGPEVRREQARKFDQGETDIIVSTDAIAMGMNLPIKRIVFSALTKFIDNEEFPISASEIKQISGRAGRYKRFPVGEVSCLARVEEGISLITESIHSSLPQSRYAMVGPDLDIFGQVNTVLAAHNLSIMGLSEFLRLFNTMTFSSPFYCVDLREMIELADIVEEANKKYSTLSASEIFGFACAPVNMGIPEHLQYYVHILNNFIRAQNIQCEEVNPQSDNIDYLETSIKCVELYQWLARHFNNKHFEFDESKLLENKSDAIDKLNGLLSDRLVKNCSSCGVKLAQDSQFSICEQCFSEKRRRYRPRNHQAPPTHQQRYPRDARKDGPGHEKRSKNGPSKRRRRRKFPQKGPR